ncbi:MAG: SGNH/GDSL hydrolase family protein [Clostridia bacterium]|nr:SGNH/GDSL hydrolase family protein [Clostridia bacterium]
METKNLKINFLGDSITEGVGTSGKDKIYHALLKEELGLAEARNYGISGTRFALQKGTPHRPKNDYVDVNSFSERFAQMDDDADVVVVFGGTNDYGHGDAPIGGFSDRTPDTFYGACHYLFSGLIKNISESPSSLSLLCTESVSSIIPAEAKKMEWQPSGNMLI